MLRKKSRVHVRAKRRTLHCEFLEDRRVLATFTVGDLGDTSDANPGDGIAADAAGNTTLRAAIEEANALAGADDINFSVAGTINLTLGELSVSEDLSIVGGGVTVDAGGASRVLNASGGDVALSDMTLTNGFDATLGGGVYSTSNLSLSSVTVSNSSSAGNAGGIASFGGNLTLDNSTVSGNESYQYGGGILALQGQVSITNNSLISGNSVNHTGGGFSSGAGVAVGNQAYFTTPLAGTAPFDLTIDASTVEGNVLYGSNFPYGAGVYAFGYGTIDITNSIITGNSATGSGGARGGAGFNWPAAAYGPGTTTINITDTLIDGNFASEESGGFGFRSTSIDNPVVMNITDSTITNNVAYGSGAAGFNWSAGDDPNSATLNITGSTISGNSAADTGGGFELNNTNFTIADSTINGNSSTGSGGGFYASGSYLDDYGFTPPIASFTRTTISNNYTGGSGGGLYAYDAGVLLDNSTISGNTAAGNGGAAVKRTYFGYIGTTYETFVDLESATVTDNYGGGSGGGAYGDYYSTLRFHNSIISGNSDGTGAAPNIYALLMPVSTYSLIGDATGSPLAAGNPDANGNLVGDSGSPIDAMLGALVDNGGSTLTHLPMAGSPVIDAGDMTSMGGTDQRGSNRVNDGRIDMGSVETGSGPMVTGDFNGDGLWDCLDINALTGETAAGTNDPAFDLTGDGLVNSADITDWLAVAGGINLASMNSYAVGDANLDGFVDGLDFIEWNSNKFTPNTDWCAGNFNGDGFVDGLDFIEWNTNKFTQQGPITSNPDTPGTIDTIAADADNGSGQRVAKQQRLAKVGRGRPATVAIPMTAEIGAHAVIETADTRRFESAPSARPLGNSLAVHQVQKMSDSVSHAKQGVVNQIDLVFAEL